MSYEYENPAPQRNGMALAALILGLFALVTSPIGLGGILGIIALILGIIAVTRTTRKGMAITGIITGALAIPAACIALLIWTLAVPAFVSARDRAMEVRAITNLTRLTNACFIYSADWNDHLPEHLAIIVANRPPGIDVTTSLVDPRLKTTPMIAPPPGVPWRSIESDVDAHCDFYYAPPTRFGGTRNSSQFILLYDKGARPTRIVAFADGHVDRFPPYDTSRLTSLVEAANRERSRQGLAPLPLDLRSPPPPPPIRPSP